MLNHLFAELWMVVNINIKNQKKTKNKKDKQKQTEIKGIRISMRTGQHDLETKIKQIEKFLGKGDKVRIEMIL